MRHKRFTLRLARADEFATIAGWRSAHHAEMSRRNGLPTFAGVGFFAATWLVAVDALDEPLAAASFVDSGNLRTIHDFYFAPGFIGRRASVFVLANLLRFSDDLGRKSVGNTNAQNTEYRRLLGRFGFVEYHVDSPSDTVYFSRQRGAPYVGKLQKLIAN